MSKHPDAAVLGAGVIGASWAALISAAGYDVAIYDPSPEAETSVRDYVANALPTLHELGLAGAKPLGQLRFFQTAGSAVDGARFIQESVPERLPIKHALYQDIEAALAPDAIVASSASGLTLSEMQQGWRNPGQFVLGHPFNPPHLIPLVEVMGNEQTADGVVEAAREFYHSIGKVTIELNREVPGHVANRLQAALWREAIHLIKQGVASVEDVDKAVWAGPGLRWAAMGPTMLFHLAAGPGGMKSFCDRYADSFDRWWDDLGVLHFDDETARLLDQGIRAASNQSTQQDLARTRDMLITGYQKAAKGIPRA